MRVSVYVRALLVSLEILFGHVCDRGFEQVASHVSARVCVHDCVVKCIRVRACHTQRVFCLCRFSFFLLIVARAAPVVVAAPRCASVLAWLGRSAMALDVNAAVGQRRGGIHSLANVLDQARGAGSLPTRKRMYQANRELFDAVRTDVVVQDSDGNDLAIPIADVQLLADHLCRTSEVTRALFIDLLESEPCTMERPTKMVFAWDEYKPGNQRDPANPRKTMVLACSFCSFPPCVLSDERAWWTVAMVRTRLLDKVEGGWGAVLRCILRKTFLESSGIAKAGLVLDLGVGAPRSVFVRCGALLSDNEGIQKGLNLKGFAGNKCCLRCSNVWRLGAAPDGDVDISCSDWAACHPLSTDTLYDIIDMIDGAAARVRDGRMPKARLAELETGFGLNFSSRGVLFDRPLLQELNILCTLRTDWMHGELQHGSMAEELQGFLLAAERELGLTWRFWREYSSARAHAHPALANC